MSAAGLLSTPPARKPPGSLALPLRQSEGRPSARESQGLISTRPVASPASTSSSDAPSWLPDRLGWIRGLPSTPPPLPPPPPPRPWFGGAEGAWKGDANDRPNMSYAEDGARTFVSGLEKGVAGTLGLPGTLLKLYDVLSHEGAASNDSVKPALPDSDYFDNIFQSVLGRYHTPQTWTGGLADEIGQNTSGALLGLGIARGVKYAADVAPFLLSELRPASRLAAAATKSLSAPASEPALSNDGRALFGLSDPAGAGATEAGSTGRAATAPLSAGAAAVDPPATSSIKAGLNALGRGVRKDYRRTFFLNHPELKGLVYVHHSVPQAVLKRYPGLFTEAEMHAYENLRGIPIESHRILHLGKINQAWTKFYRDSPKATREEILNHAKSIDALYGKQFLPPIH